MVGLSKTQMIAYALLIISIIIIGSSTYGTGKNEGDKSSLGYRVASSFMVIGIVFFLIALGILFFKDFLGSSCPTISSSSGGFFGSSGNVSGPTNVVNTGSTSGSFF